MQAVAHTDAHIRVRRSGVVSRELGGGGGGGGCHSEVKTGTMSLAVRPFNPAHVEKNHAA